MSTTLLIARFLLALVFLVAGVAKLADRKGSRQTIINFGLPAALAAPLGVLLPLAEMAVAAALLPAATAWWGAVGAIALLLLFVVGIGINLAVGRKPDCHCFGQLHSAPAGWSTLIRNGLLAAVAGFILWEGREGETGSSVGSLVGWLGATSSSQALILIGVLAVLALIAAQWWFLTHLLRQNGRVLLRLEALEARPTAGGENGSAVPSRNGAQHAPPPLGLPLGTQAPSFDLPGLYGENLTLESLRASGKPVMLLFTDPNCGPCNTLLPEIGHWQQEHAEKLVVSPISRGGAEENRAKSAEHGVTNVVLQEDWEVARAYQVSGTPSAVLIQPDGRIGSPVVGGSEAIQSLVDQAVRGEAPTQLPMYRRTPVDPCPNCGKVHAADHAAQQALSPGPKVGELAPEIELPNLSGETIRLEDFSGKETLVLFWNPGCGFCQQMLDDLKALESDSSEGAPQILVVSAGSAEANESMDLSSPVGLDQDFRTGRSFGVGGTPSAVLVDAEGKVASEAAVGAPAVLALATSKHDPANPTGN